MTTSELKYLMALDDLKKEQDDVIMARIASYLGIARSSTKIAFDKLKEQGLVEFNGNLISFTTEGYNKFLEYKLVVDYLTMHFNRHCKTPLDIAKADSINIVCMISDITRKGFFDFLKEHSNH